MNKTINGKEVREFWINTVYHPNGNADHDIQIDYLEGTDYTHVIEYSYAEHLESVIIDLTEALVNFANIEAYDGDDFSGVHEDVILRVECTAGDLHTARDAISKHKDLISKVKGEYDKKT